MAHDESSREDLLREATALVERIELVPHSFGASSAANDLGDAHVVAGFRADGALSVFFGEDPVYQFNAVGELRRAYCDGVLLKAVRGRLVTLQRVRTQHEVQLVRHELSDADQAAFLTQMTDYLRKLATTIGADSFHVAGQMPPGADVLGRLRTWLATHNRWPIAARPNASR